jgi:hypothetical protein
MFPRLATNPIASTWTRLGWLALALFAGASTGAANPPGSAGASPGYEIIRLGRGHFNRIDFAAVIDGVKGLIVVDTGASATLLNAGTYGFLLKNGVKRPDKMPATARINENSFPVAIAKDVQLGTVHLHNVPFPLGPSRYFYDTSIEGASDRVYDGYLGENVLRHYNAVVDCARLALYLNTDPARKVDLDRGLTQNGWTRIPMESVGYDFVVPCRLGGHPYRLVVDTGSPFTIFNTAILLKEHISQRELNARAGVIGYHPEVESLVTLDTLPIGDYTASTVHCLSSASLRRPLALSKAKPGDAPLAGLLGGDTLAANGAMIDIGNHALYLKHAGASGPATP